MPYFAYKKSGAAANTDSSAPDHDVFCCGNGIWSDVYADRKLQIKRNVMYLITLSLIHN